MTPVWLHPDDGGAYHEVHTGIEAGLGHDAASGTIMAVLDSGAILGAALFNNYNPQSGVIEVHAAAHSARWLTRRTLKELFSYPFDELKCQALVMRTHPANKRVQRIGTAYGFKRYEIPRLRGRDVPEVILVLGDDEWRSNGFHKER